MAVVGRAFRFGVIGAPTGTPEQWRATARQAAELGYSTLLMPDVPHLPAPGPALGVAAGAAGIGVATWVYAAPARTPRQTAREAHSLSVLTGGRFEMGIGAGRPNAGDYVRAMGMTWGSAAERLGQVEATIDALRELDGSEGHTPVLVAAGGPKARALAAAKADIVGLAVGPLAERPQYAEWTAEIRAVAAARGADIEFAMNLAAVGDELPEQQLRQQTGLDPAELIARDSLMLLPGGPDAMRDELLRRREELGVSYVLVSSAFMTRLAPVVEMVRGA